MPQFLEVSFDVQDVPVLGTFRPTYIAGVQYTS